MVSDNHRFCRLRQFEPETKQISLYILTAGGGKQVKRRPPKETEIEHSIETTKAFCLSEGDGT